MHDASFFGGFSFDVPVGPEQGNRAFFGQNVLQGLIDGIDDFVQESQPRWRRGTYRIGPPTLLGCSPWISDHALLETIEKLPSACVVISKQPRTSRDANTFGRLRQLNERTNGIELRALTQLADRAPKVDGAPLLLGPYTTIDPDLSVPTFRTIGYRRTGPAFPPIAHAKLALLGNVCWTDEDPLGNVTDYVWFRPGRLWISSANFTYASRRSLECGYWTENEDLIRGVERFLITLIGFSEDLDAPADAPYPDLANVEYDDEAMTEAAAQAYQARLEEAEIRGEELDDDEW